MPCLQIVTVKGFTDSDEVKIAMYYYSWPVGHLIAWIPYFDPIIVERNKSLVRLWKNTARHEKPQIFLPFDPSVGDFRYK